MRAAVLVAPGDISARRLVIKEVPRPEVKPGHVLLRVRACGVCRTDLHIVEGELHYARLSAYLLTRPIKHTIVDRDSS
jgi:D-arabinose 1-dehydrogenase-like Zn-dependent alcohol dehydrogenase